MNSTIIAFLGIASPLFIVVGLTLFEVTRYDGYFVAIVAGAVLYLWLATARGIARESPRHLASRSRLMVGCVVATLGGVIVSVGIEDNLQGTLGSAGSQIVFAGVAVFVLGISVFALSLALASPNAKF